MTLRKTEDGFVQLSLLIFSWRGQTRAAYRFWMHQYAWKRLFL